MKLPFKDRRILEQVIFPYIYSDPARQNILFIGCHWYTRHYPRFFQDRRFITIDPLAKRAKYGADEHYIDKIESAESIFKPATLDVIICNGVIGWGLDKKADAEKAFANCYDSLKKGGLMIIGWNNRRGRIPFDLDDVIEAGPFTSFGQSPLPANPYHVSSLTRHVYHFLVKE